MCRVFSLVLLVVCAMSCERSTSPAIGVPTANPQLVLYVSADDALYRPVIQTFEAATGAKVATRV